MPTQRQEFRKCTENHYFSDRLPAVCAHADEVDKRKPKPPSAAREVYYGRSEVRTALTVASGGFGEKAMTPEEKAQKATGALSHGDFCAFASSARIMWLRCCGQWANVAVV
jgi:hypothetical protein